MFKNVCKVAISKDFLFCLLVVCLMFTSFGLFMEDSYAVDSNVTADEVKLECDIEDKLENSQENEMLKEVDCQKEEIIDEFDSKDLESLEDIDFDEKKVLGKGDSEILGANNGENDVLSKEYTVTGNTFKDIRDAVNGASDGDIIVLKGSYSAESASDRIVIDKKLTITSASTATLDGKGISNCFILKSNAKGTIIKNLKFVNCSSSKGPAIRINATDVTIAHCTFEKNRCERGGAVYTEYDMYLTRNLIIKYCNFTKNVADARMYDREASAGALAVYGTNSQVYNCIFDSNWVYGSDDSYGGAIQAGLDEAGSSVKIKNCIFKNNGVTCEGMSHGGAGCVRTGTEYSDCIFINNTANMGGALTFHSSGGVVNCIFINNTANKYYGGAISTGLMSGYMEFKVADSYFEGNTAPKGGAIQVYGSNVKISNSNFTNNRVTTYGGAINIEAENVTVVNSRFESNIANVDGGALYIKGSNTIVKGSTFISNHAIPDVKKLKDGLGGAIYVNSKLASIQNNFFKYNTARNGSAIYYDKSGERLTLINNNLYQNQAWVYGLPISAEDIYYTDDEEIEVVLYGGNNIARYNNLAVSNAIYNAASNDKITIDGQSPIDGATNTGDLYQDDREYNMEILLTVQHEDGTVVYNNSLNTSYLGKINVCLENLKAGTYSVSAKHIEDTYYKGITNVTTFRVIPKVDNRISKSVEYSTYNFDDVAVWTLTVSNSGPSNSTGVKISDLLPDGLTWVNDTAGGKYDPKTGILDVGELGVNETMTFKIITVISKTGTITNRANITSQEIDSDMLNNHDEKSIFVNPACDLAVVKTASNSNPNYKDTIIWTITVSNNGPDIAHNVTVRDVLPKSLKYVESDGDYNPQNGIWNIGTLGINSKAQLKIKCIVASTGVIQNNVSVNGSEYDYDLSNNKNQKMLFVKSASDLSITKSVNATAVNYGDSVKWTLVISNNGPDNATDVKVSDVLPEGFSYLNSTLPKGTYSNGVFDIGNLNVGERIVINIFSKVIATGEYTNIANISSNEHDFDLTNNKDDASILVYQASDLSVAKYVSEKEPVYGDTIIWTIVVSNNGPDTAHGIVVTDLLPDSLVWIEDNSKGSYNPKTGIWNINQLAADESVTLNIECRVNGTGTIQNNVSVSAREHDCNQTNNHANESIEVEKFVDVSIVKSTDNSSPNYGDLIKWTLVISNSGPDKATDVYVEEKLPKSLILLNYTASKGFYDEGIWAMCCLNKGDVETLEIICRVNGTGKIDNSVSIYANENDLNPKNNHAEASIDVPLTVDLEVVKKVNNANPLITDEITWMISVKNNGPDTATGVVLHDVLGKDLTVLRFKSSKGDFANGQWNIGSLAKGKTEYLNITCISKAVGKITNHAEAVSNEHDMDETNNFDDATVNVKPVSDLSIVKSANVTTVNYGDLIKWTLTASNKGPNTATGVTVTDKLPKGLTVVSASGKYYNGVWKIGNLNVGESKQLEIICRATSSGELSNNVDITGNEHDSNLENNHDDESVIVNPACDLQITKVASKYYYYIGDVVEYVIEVANNGPDTAYNVNVKEVLDSSLNLKSFKLTKGKFNKASKTWSIDSIKAGKSEKLYVNAIATASGKVKNSVSVSNDVFDYDLTNNKDSAWVKVSKKVTKKSPNQSEDKKSKKVTNNKKLNKLLKNKNLRYLINSGSLNKLIKNKNFMNLVKSGSLSKLLKNRNFLDLVKSGSLDKLLKNKYFYKLIKEGYLEKLLKNGYLYKLAKSGNLYKLSKDSNVNKSNDGKYSYNSHSSKTVVTSYRNEYSGGNNELNEYCGSILENHASGNPFAMLVLSLMFSIIFVSRNYFK